MTRQKSDTAQTDLDSRLGKPGRRSFDERPQDLGPRVAKLRAQLGFSQEEFARLIGLSVRAVAYLIAEVAKGSAAFGPASPRNTEQPSRRTGKARGQTQRSVAELEQLHEALARVFREEAIGDWLRTPNPGFGGLKPLEVVERGEVNRIYRMIYQIESGVPT